MFISPQLHFSREYIRWRYKYLTQTPHYCNIVWKCFTWNQQQDQQREIFHLTNFPWNGNIHWNKIKSGICWRIFSWTETQNIVAHLIWQIFCEIRVIFHVTRFDDNFVAVCALRICVKYFYSNELKP